MFVIALLSLVAVASAGVIQHEDHSGHGHPQATSYQLVKIENYQPVPIYIRKEHQQLLDHPVLKGHTATKLKLHHGSYQGKHHGGYAIATGTHEQGVSGHHEDAGHQGSAGYAAQGHEGQGLGAYAENPSHAYGGQQAYEHESAGYEQQGGGAGAGYGHESAGYEQEAGAGAGYGHESAGYEQQEAGGAAEGGYGQETAGHGQESAGYGQQEQDSGYDHQAYAQAVAEHARQQAASGGEHGHQKYQH